MPCEPHRLTPSEMVRDGARRYNLGMPSPAIFPVTCAICSTGFRVGRQRFETSKSFTCSKACLAALRSQNMRSHRATDQPTSATCPVCGENFDRKASQIAKYASSYCSRECRAIGIRGPNEKLITGSWLPCETCTRPIWRTPATLRPHNYCSHACFGLDPASKPKSKPNTQGEKNWRWKGGFIPYGPGWTPTLRASIRKRDGHQCRNCGFKPTRSRQLHVHHLDGSKTNHDPANLVTLCNTCHAKHHHGTVVLDLMPV